MTKPGDNEFRHIKTMELRSNSLVYRAWKRFRLVYVYVQVHLQHSQSSAMYATLVKTTHKPTHSALPRCS